LEKWPKGLSPTELAEWLDREFTSGLMVHLGMKVVEVGPVRAVVQLPVSEGVATPMGSVHAGAMVSLADTSATLAATVSYEHRFPGEQLWPDRFPVAVSISSQVLSNVRDGLLIAESVIPHTGRTMIAAATRITSADGRLLALVNSSHYVRPLTPGT
jgi:uncharacterized protein (TIGR00369 family)